jgi:hypothetical protein
MICKRMKIKLEIEEYDTLRFLTLIRKETRQVSGPWQSYWQHLAECVEIALHWGPGANGCIPLNETESTQVRIVDEALPPD